MADIISTLPDAILCHILSFLQTKQSVATSILSKRWNHLWLSVPTLYFDESDKTVKDVITTLEFKDFVNSVLLQRDATLPIKSFYFQVPCSYDFPNLVISITKWVSFVLQRRVEYACLHLNTWEGFPEVPITIFTCKTLMVLNLSRFCMKECDSSSAVLLPSLKTLHLEFIAFPKLRDFMMFLSRCPILEELYTFHVSFGFDESLNCNEWNCLSNLIRAEILSTSYFPFKAVHNVQSLRFQIKQVNYHGLVPTFHNLTQLDLSSLRHSCQFLVEVLNHCPKLQKLDFHQTAETWNRKEYREKWVDPDVVPQCLSLHLTTCNLFNFLGLQDELELAKYILKKAKVLQTMQIWNPRHFENERIISSYPRASSTCKVTVCRDY